MNKERNTQIITDKLHALADGQLAADEREEILDLLENDVELRGEMCDIYRVKNLVQTAYPMTDFEQKPAVQTAYNFYSLAKVASYFFAVILTFAAGYLLRDSNFLNHSISNDVFSDAKAGSLATAPVQDNKVIIFLSSSEPEKFIHTLSKAETLAKKYSETNGKVYVVTSAQGLDLLRLATTPHQKKIKALTNLYPSLRFVACNNSLYMFKKEGKPTELIDEVELAPSAVEFVVKHLQKGWRYIAI